MGELTQELDDKIIYYCVIRKFPEIMLIEDRITLRELYNYYAVMQMDNDYEKANYRYHEWINEITKRK